MTKKRNKERKKRKFPLIFLLIVAFLLGGGILGMFSYSNDTAEIEEAGENYFEAVTAGELTKAYYEYTSKEFQKETSLEAFKQGIRGYSLFQGKGSIQFNKRDSSSENGFLQGFVKTVEGVQAPISLWFVKEEGEWKLERMEAGPSMELAKKYKLIEELQAPILSQLEAIQKGEIEKAYLEKTSEEFKKSTDFDHFKHFISSFPILQQGKIEEIVDVDVEDSEATLDIALKQEKERARLIYELVKQQGEWKIFSFQVISSENISSIHDKDLEEVEGAVRKEINLIKEGKIDDAYLITSTSFKAGTSLAEFTTFLNAHPFFMSHEEVKIKKWIDANIGKAFVEILSETMNHFLDFTLFKEGGNWKVWGMEITPGSNENEDLDEREKLIFSIIEKIKEGKLKEAYEQEMSQEFKKGTSLEEFENFIDKDAYFLRSYKNVKLQRIVLEENTGIIQADFSFNEKGFEILEFELIKEEGIWKLIGIKILNSDEGNPSDINLRFLTALGNSTNLIITPNDRGNS